MLYTVPHTIAPGELVTILTMNTEWGGNAEFLANPPAVRARKSNQNITTATDTLLTWDLEDWDWATTPLHSTVSNTSRLIAPVPGKYRFKLQTDWDGNTAGQRSCFVGKNTAGTPPGLGASRLAAQTNYGGGVTADMEVTIEGELAMVANDYIEAFVYQTSGGTRVHGGAQRATASFSLTWFSL